MTILLIYIVHCVLFSRCVCCDMKSICHMRFHDFLRVFEKYNEIHSINVELVSIQGSTGRLIRDVRVVQTQAISFLKSMSEKGGSRNSISESFDVGSASSRHFFSKIKWIGSELPLNLGSKYLSGPRFLISSSPCPLPNAKL